MKNKSNCRYPSAPLMAGFRLRSGLAFGREAGTEKQGTCGTRQFSKAIPQSSAGKDWHLSYFCLRHVRLGKDIHATGLPRRNATIHPRIPEEVLAVEGVFQSGMDIQHLLVDAEAAVYVDIETIVCRTALGVD